MINDNQKYFDRMHVLIDALVLALSYVLSWYCYVRLGVMNNHAERGILPPATYMMALLYIVPGYLLLTMHSISMHPSVFREDVWHLPIS